MYIQIEAHNEERVIQALTRREELLRQRTIEMPNDWMQELDRAEGIIASAVAWAVKSGAAQ